MKEKKAKTIKAVKTRLKKTLPEKISIVIDSYEEFLKKNMPDDAKGFSAHHAACKSAVTHLETLLKLARWTVDENKDDRAFDESENDIWKIIAEAKVEKDEGDEN
ncbi:MAG: hypothetical protein LBR70_05210 [Lactobacillaceae bacterium]|jgi:hypothetical protein|nr:hypothetical protein [Lactobacillaceae bacterium]